MDFAEPVAEFFEGDLAESVRVNGRSVRAIFRTTPAMGSIGVGGMSTREVSALLPTASVPTDPVGKTIVRLGVSYRIAQAEPESDAITRLTLERVA